MRSPPQRLTAHPGALPEHRIRLDGRTLSPRRAILLEAEPLARDFAWASNDPGTRLLARGLLLEYGCSRIETLRHEADLARDYVAQLPEGGFDMPFAGIAKWISTTRRRRHRAIRAGFARAIDIARRNKGPVPATALAAQRWTTRERCHLMEGAPRDALELWGWPRCFDTLHQLITHEATSLNDQAYALALLRRLADFAIGDAQA